MTSKSTYDQIYHQSSDYNPKAHRDDRQHSNFVGLFQIQEVDRFFFFFVFIFEIKVCLFFLRTKIISESNVHRMRMVIDMINKSISLKINL